MRPEIAELLLKGSKPRNKRKNTEKLHVEGLMLDKGFFNIESIVSVKVKQLRKKPFVVRKPFELYYNAKTSKIGILYKEVDEYNLIITTNSLFFEELLIQNILIVQKGTPNESKIVIQLGDEITEALEKIIKTDLLGVNLVQEQRQRHKALTQSILDKHKRDLELIEYTEEDELNEYEIAGLIDVTQIILDQLRIETVYLIKGLISVYYNKENDTYKFYSYSGVQDEIENKREDLIPYMLENNLINTLYSENAEDREEHEDMFDSKVKWAVKRLIKEIEKEGK